MIDRSLRREAIKTYTGGPARADKRRLKRGPRQATQYVRYFRQPPRRSRSGTSLQSLQSGVSHESAAKLEEETMNGLIYLIGLIVVILFILSFLGLR
jgi:hypothetical protein